MLTGMNKLKHASSVITVAMLILAGIAGRLLPHAPNATPLTALALVSGASLCGYRAIFIPLCTLFLTDLLIGTYSIEVMVSVYLCFLLPVFLGKAYLKSNRRPLLIGSLAALSSVIFFRVTNFSIWYFGDWYPENMAGLMACYAAALPFALNMLSADLIWSATLFAGLAMIEGRTIAVKLPTLSKS